MSHHRACCCVGEPCDAITTVNCAEVTLRGVNVGICSHCHGDDAVANVTYESLNADGTYLVCRPLFGGHPNFLPRSNIPKLGYVRGTAYQPDGFCTTLKPFSDPDCDALEIDIEIFLASQQIINVTINKWGSSCGISGAKVLTFFYEYLGGFDPVLNVGDWVPNRLVCSPGVDPITGNQHESDGGEVRICGIPGPRCGSAPDACDFLNGSDAPISYTATYAGITLCCSANRARITVPTTVNGVRTLPLRQLLGIDNVTGCLYRDLQSGTLIQYEFDGCTGSEQTFEGTLLYDLIIWRDLFGVQKTQAFISFQSSGGGVNLFASDQLTHGGCDTTLVYLSRFAACDFTTNSLAFGGSLTAVPNF